MRIINEIKEYYGKENVDESTKDFRRQNIVIFNHNESKLFYIFTIATLLAFMDETLNG